jgi:hypothetical protein
MGLIKSTVVEQYGITIDNIYWKIDNENGIQGGKGKIRVSLSGYLTKEKADNDDGCAFRKIFMFTPDLTSADNFIKQAYTFIKTTTEFKDAVDA